MLLATSLGCAALRPIKGIPAKYYPEELRGITRSGKETIDLSRLRQTPPAEYLVDAGDVLGIYVEGVLGRRDEVPPVYFPTTGEVPPTLGFPIPVRDDRTISLPLIQPIPVGGLTVRQVEEAIRRAYTQDQQILQPGNDRILVGLQKPRSYQVLVIRQESTVNLAGGSGVGTLNLGSVKRGSGQTVTLPAYRNDVLHALAETGGLPGLDAQNAVYVLRRGGARGGFCPPVVAPHPVSAVRPVSATFPAPNPFGHVRRAELTSERAIGPGHSRVVVRSDDSSPARSPALPDWSTANSRRRPPGLENELPLQTSPQAFSQPVPQRLPPGLPTSEPGVELLPQPLPPTMTPPLGTQFDIPPEMLQADGTGPGTQVVRIPIRLSPGEFAEFSEQDILLHDGDIVFIESRETEIFYVGGLLGGGQYTLPRDYDLDVLGAISIATSRQASSGSGQGIGNRVGGISAMNQDISVSASDVVILRQLPDGNQIPIKVDLTRALRDPRERILIQPGDYVILQYKPMEAVAAFVERNLLAGSLIGLATTSFGSGGGN